MKKILSLLACTLWFVASLSAGERVISLKELPTSAQQLIATHFNEKQLLNIVAIKNWKSTHYKVSTAEGGMIVFNKKGEWREISCKKGAVPAKLIPDFVQTHINANYPKARLTDIHVRANGGYEIWLSNGYHVLFDKSKKAVYTDTK